MAQTLHGEENKKVSRKAINLLMKDEIFPISDVRKSTTKTSRKEYNEPAIRQQ